MLKCLFDASYEAKFTLNTRKLVRFTFSHAIKADTRQKVKLKTSDA